MKVGFKSEVTLREKIKKYRTRIRKLEQRQESEQLQTQRILRYRYQFESLISSISTYLIRPDHHAMDDAILHTLQSIATFMHVDRCYILEFSDDLTLINLVHQWAISTVEPLKKFKDIPSETFPYATRKLFKGEILNTPRISDLPPSARAIKKFMEENQTKSLIIVPTISAGMVVGGIGFDSVHEEKKWTHDAVTLLRFAGEIIINALKRKKIEEALRESEKNYRKFFEEDLTGDFIADASGKIQFCNPAFSSMFGFNSVREVLTTPSFRLKFNDSHSEDLLNRIKKEKVIEGQQFELCRKDGEPVHVICNITGIFDKEDELIEARGYLFDITEQKKVEEQLRGSQKMEAIGRLAGGVAHDFNNLLTVINGHCELLIKQPLDGINVLKNIEEIKKAGERAASLTGQLLAFSRKQIIKPKIVNINTAIIAIEAMLRRLITENIEFITVLDPTLGNIKIDPGQFEQVILNLAVNAKDAMPMGGKLTIETKNVNLDGDLSLRHIPIEPGSYIILKVSDTGVGMDKDTQSHIFEPFFTTKEKGKGTGLGLSTIYGIIKQCHGYVWVDSKPNKGTTFHVLFPRIDEKVSEDTAQDVPYETVKGMETIIVVEDDDAVRELTESFLRHYGYSVLTACSGKEALEICSTFDGRIDLAVIDVVMPGLSGKELSDEITKIFTDIKILFISGYTDESIVQHGILDSQVQFLQKPFSVESLGKKVRRVLDSPK